VLPFYSFLLYLQLGSRRIEEEGSFSLYGYALDQYMHTRKHPVGGGSSSCHRRHDAEAEEKKKDKV